MTVTLHPGLPPHLRHAAAALYWQAFGGKLAAVMGPTPRALRYLDRVLREDHAITALAGGQLVGIIGFKSPQGSFADGSMADLAAVYGRFGGLWRGAAMNLLSREVDNTRFLIDGICVDRAWRSRGIGAALLDAICAEAAARGYAAVRLDVIDTNWRARALYERQGFIATRTQKIGLLRHIFGFDAAITMVRPLPQQPT